MTDRNTNHFRGRHYAADHITGPVPFLNPTTRLLPLHKPKEQGRDQQAAPHPPTAEGDEDEAPEKQPASTPDLTPTATHSSGVYHIWRSRDNRKGRHALALTRSAEASAAVAVGAHQHKPRRTTTTGSTLQGIARMFLRYPVWDVSYDVATIFTLGSVVWVLNGFFVLLPTTNPGSSWPGESAWGGGVSAVVGATIFEVGSVLLMLEAVNENRSDCFGWALEEALGHGGAEGRLVLRREKSRCNHHHRDKRAFLTGTGVDGSDGNMDAGEQGDASSGQDEGGSTTAGRRWTWWPSWYELRTHYFREIGFLACLSQMIGATIFWISGFTGLPQVLGVLTVPAENGIFWLPQVVGGTGFIISSWLFMLETQPNWHTPSLTTLGWHIGFWNLVGALGFTLCGALGFASGSSPACETASLWSTFIGSWAFLVGSIIQWYESLDKYPVTVIDKKFVGPGASSSGILEKI
ncbi:hypothetical protein J7T55_000913 [Diaporthe amygdali]|uniref:uncharacterized protein n=1 Tax=Phomopsis amygdali TaxID=1214568 RepID=UPI0022FEA770|nr:uncharacterized protein J7T55_000913 [Diaporthe amygdali]KAJ0120060.1 hypothetical protein J7T55_000913 [Diaporthe amygdali]